MATPPDGRRLDGHRAMAIADAILGEGARATLCCHHGIATADACGSVPVTCNAILASLIRSSLMWITGEGVGGGGGEAQ